jgi:DNA-binding MarR family transcriptional regulator
MGSDTPGEVQSRAAAAPALDDTIHQRVRLGIVSALAGAGTMSFNDLRAVLGLTDGNLAVHARKLEEAGYLEVRKGFAGRTPRTEFALTDAGRQALERYLSAMEDIMRAARGPGS